MKRRLVPRLPSLLAALCLMSTAGVCHADFFTAGMQAYHRGDYHHALQPLRLAAQADPQRPAIRYYLADTLLKLRRFPEAQAEYQTILATAPGSDAATLAQNALSRLRTLYLESYRLPGNRIKGVTGSLQGKTSGRITPGTGQASAGDRLNLAMAGAENYLDEIAYNGQLVRWSVRQQPLRLYIQQSPSGIRNFQPAFTARVKDAMDVWMKAMSYQMSYALVSSPEQADISVTWVNGLDTRGRDSGSAIEYTSAITVPVFENDQLQAMRVKLATFNIMGQPHSQDSIFNVAVHELGHALGLLGHSNNPDDIMYAKTFGEKAQLSPRDLATIRLLYSRPADITSAESTMRVADSGPSANGDRLKRLDEALARQEAKAMGAEGNNLDWINLGSSYLQKAQYLPDRSRAPWFEKAIDAFSRAIALEPKDPRAHFNRSVAHYQRGDFTQALADVEKAIQYDNTEPDYYLQQSGVFLGLRQKARAQSALQAYLTRNPAAATSSMVQQLQAEIAKL